MPENFTTNFAQSAARESKDAALNPPTAVLTGLEQQNNNVVPLNRNGGDAHLAHSLTEELEAQYWPR